MKIGIAGPISLDLLNVEFKENEIPNGVFSFPMIAIIANGFLELGHEVIIYTYARNIEHPITIKKNQITICIGKHSPSPGRRFFKNEINSLLNLMKEHPADIINAQWTYEYALAALRSGIPTVVTVRDHASTILKYQFDPYRLVRWCLNYKVFKQCKYLIANSYYLENLINKGKGIVKVIPNFYKEALDEHYDKTKIDSNKIVSVANGFGGRKNIKAALHAFKIIRQRYPDSEYHIIGKQMQEGASAYQYAMRYDLTKGVVFKGPMDYNEVIEEVRTSRVLLHPSKEETFGNSVLEAMVLGTPVVGGERSGNIPYLLNKGVAGVLCDINSPKSIAKAISKLFDNDDLWNEIRSHAKSYATSNYNKDRVIDQLVNYYKYILGREKQ